MILEVFVDNQRKKENPEQLYLMDASIVDELWKRCDISRADYLKPGTVRDPRCWVFAELMNEFYFNASRARLNDNGDSFYLYFNEGRHRTRWLLDAGVKEIPLGIREDSIKVLQKYDVPYRRVEPGCIFDMPIDKKGIIRLYESEGERDSLFHH